MKISYMLGRCANGCERDKGKLLHAINNHSWRAVCGAAPGKRSAGWREYAPGEDAPSILAVTCPKCRKNKDWKVLAAALLRETEGA